jgi:hypothetical protein
VRASVLRTSIAGVLKDQGELGLVCVPYFRAETAHAVFAGNFAKALEFYRKSLDDKAKLLGNRHTVVAVSM